MPTCLKCTQFFPYQIIIDSKLRSLTKRKYCLNCSPFGQRNTIKLHIVEVQEKGLRKCLRCKTVKNAQDFYTRSNGHLHVECRACMKDRVNIRARKNKEIAINLLGGKCSKCGYNKCPAALDFHHLDRSSKEVGISNILTRSMDRIKDELKKCIILCANCHRELEAESL